MARAPLIDEKIDLFSNAVSGNGHVNTCDDFVNMLPEPCNMQDVEVCVKQITIPTSWDPIPHHHRDTTRLRWIVKFNSEVVNFQKVITGQNTKWVGEGHHSLVFTLKPGIYDTAKEVVEQMKVQTNMTFPAQEPGWPTWVNETYDDLPQRILIREIGDAATMFANASLCHALHYAQHDPNGDNIPMHAIIGDVFRPLSRSPTSSRTIFPENAIDLDHEPDVNVDPSIQIQRFFFYADFIRDRVVNGEKQPLLTSVHNPGLSIKETQLSYTINYTVPLYIPVKPMILRHLRVWVLDDHNNPVRFNGGSVHILLHFRRRQGWGYHRL